MFLKSICYKMQSVGTYRHDAQYALNSRNFWYGINMNSWKVIDCGMQTLTITFDNSTCEVHFMQKYLFLRKYSEKKKKPKSFVRPKFYTSKYVQLKRLINFGLKFSWSQNSCDDVAFFLWNIWGNQQWFLHRKLSKVPSS